jgi:hypothetical protein
VLIETICSGCTAVVVLLTACMPMPVAVHLGPLLHGRMASGGVFVLSLVLSMLLGLLGNVKGSRLCTARQHRNPAEPVVTCTTSHECLLLARTQCLNDSCLSIPRHFHEALEYVQLLLPAAPTNCCCPRCCTAQQA